MAVELPEGVTQEFVDFLLTVDLPVVRTAGSVFKIANVFKVSLARAFVCILHLTLALAS